ncbi:ABC transporter ATP-binding protein [Bernardetia sp. ABR2-2B]|uniref:ABC transporter ATP-binding protein n=1 Tax=Bernardetia sp. ABR2-2B TaxID=3127472 RepID=UPI0030CF01FE
MSNIVIKSTDISKQYRLGLVGSGTLKDDAARFWAKIRGKADPTLLVGQTNDRTQKSNSDYVWALKDINFEVKQGEILGIIGKNGAGKSTLLKILSKITAPTTGSIKIKGRIASLLEVGTGFHGELTGRENIYLNGAVLGMSRREVTRKLDEIVDFAGVEKYMDTPVKRYSSGMTVRLGFAVAAHLDPDILVVDEVLAVGDAEFQKKAIGKMKDVSTDEGRTILFVSHNMNSVKSLCTRGLLLEHGNISFDGNIDKAVARYLGGDTTNLNYKKLDDTWALEGFTLKSVAVKNRNKTIDDPIAQDDDIEVIFDYEFYEVSTERLDITLHFKGEDGTYLFVVSTGSIFENGLKLGKEKLKMYIPSGFFNEGEFTIDVFLVKGKRVAVKYEKDVIKLLVIPRKRDIGVYSGKEVGFIQPQFEWAY